MRLAHVVHGLLAAAGVEHLGQQRRHGKLFDKEREHDEHEPELESAGKTIGLAEASS